MRDALVTLAIVSACAALVFVWTSPGAPSQAALPTSEPSAERAASSVIRPIPPPIALDERKVHLGRRLFTDPGLSKDGTISCASCHDLELGGADGRTRPVGIGGQIGEVNTPTVLNSRFSFRQFWDGRAATLEEQIDGPLEHPAEMGASWEEVLARLSGDPSYGAAFAEAYPGGVTRANVKDAIATFERSLVTPDSPFDKFLRGDAEALGAEALRGYELFQSYGCVGCHQGVALGGNMFQRLGVVRDYFADRGDVTRADLGRFNVTGREADRHVFKVPTLRNVALTAPYFHDGSAASLDDAVRVMARYQLGREIPAADRAAIVAFLRSLTGELPESS